MPAPQWHRRLAVNLQEQARLIKAQATNEQVMSGKIEIKGLSQAFADAKKSMAIARQAPAELAAAVSEMVATCADLTTQVKAMHDDIKFEATQLGNGGETATKI